MRVLVLGGCGFIGSHIVDQLLLANHQVRVVSRTPERFRSPIQGVEYRLGDFTSPAFLQEALEGVDVVMHCIATMLPAASNDNPQLDVQENILGTLNLLDLMLKNGTSRLLFLSSGGTVYGSAEHMPISENDPLHPICSYGVVKVAIENYIGMYQHLHGLSPVIIRPSNPYGSRQGGHAIQGVIAAFSQAMITNSEIQVWGDGSVVRDYFHVIDLARLCVIAIASEHEGVVNAGSGTGYSLNEIVKNLEVTLNIEPNVRYMSSRACDVPKVILDCSKADKLFGWKPEISLEQGLCEYITWLKK